MHRPTLGAAAVLLLLIGLALTIWPVSGADVEQFRAACFRVGLVLAAVWLAHPQLKKLPPWTIPGVLIFLIVVAIRPKLLPLAIVVLLALAILRPRRR